MSIRGWTLTLLVPVILGFGTANASSVEALNRFSKDLKGLEGAFEQTVFDDRGTQREQSQGRIALSLPRLFRWQYETPFPQLIVADGDHVWIFDPDLEQVTVRKQALEEQSSPLAVLIDPAELERQFKTKDIGASNQPVMQQCAANGNRFFFVGGGDIHYAEIFTHKNLR